MDLPALVLDFAEHNAARLGALDSLTTQAVLPPGPGDAVLVPPGTGTPSAIGVLRTSTMAPDDPGAPWRPLAEHELQILVRDDDGAGAVAESAAAVLDLVEPELAQRAAAGDEEHSISVLTLARDEALLEPLRRHFFAPVSVTALRRVSASESLNPSYPIGLPAGVRIEPAQDCDRGALLEAAVEAWTRGAFQHRAHLRERTRESIERTVEQIVDGPQPLSAVALRGSRIIGLSLVDRADGPGTPLDVTPVRPLAVARLLWLDPAERGRGIAHALVADAHGRLAGAHLPWCATRYPAMQPMNGYFWNREGYRPLTVHWGRTPALRA